MVAAQIGDINKVDSVDSHFDLVVIGGPSLDVIHVRGEDRSTVGGAGLYTALAASRAGARTLMFAPRPSQLNPELELAATHLTWIGPLVRLEDLPSFRIAQSDNGVSTMLDARWGAEAQLSPSDVPAGGLPSRIAYCGPIADPANQVAFLRMFQRSGQRTATGTFKRAVVNDRDTVLETFALADIFFCNEEEAGMLFGTLDDARTAPGKLLYITMGARGALVVQGAHQSFIPGRPVVEIDPTGAGDTFCGTTLAYLAKGAHPLLAARHAAACAAEAVTVSGPVLLALGAGSPAILDERIVKVNQQQVSAVTALIRALPDIEAFPFMGETFPPINHPSTLDFFFSSTLQQFGFWTDDGAHYREPFVAPLSGELRKGSDYLWASYRRWLAEEPEGLSPAKQSVLTPRELSYRLRSDTGVGQLPAFEAHLAQARQYGLDMLALDWTPETILQRANASNRPLESFLTQLDQVGGYKEDWLRKKSALLAIILQQRPERFLRVDAAEEVPPIIDYHLQRSCLRTGLIEICSAELRQKLEDRRFIDTEVEAHIRYAAYIAVQQLQKASGKSMGAVDWFFFGARRRCPEMTVPECHLCAIEPACVRAVTLFQPIIRTTDY